MLQKISIILNFNDHIQMPKCYYLIRTWIGCLDICRTIRSLCVITEIRSIFLNAMFITDIALNMIRYEGTAPWYLEKIRTFLMKLSMFREYYPATIRLWISSTLKAFFTNLLSHNNKGIWQNIQVFRLFIYEEQTDIRHVIEFHEG